MLPHVNVCLYDQDNCQCSMYEMCVRMFCGFVIHEILYCVCDENVHWCGRTGLGCPC